MELSTTLRLPVLDQQAADESTEVALVYGDDVAVALVARDALPAPRAARRVAVRRRTLPRGRLFEEHPSEFLLGDMRPVRLERVVHLCQAQLPGPVRVDPCKQLPCCLVGLGLAELCPEAKSSVQPGSHVGLEDLLSVVEEDKGDPEEDDGDDAARDELVHVHQRREHCVSRGRVDGRHPPPHLIRKSIFLEVEVVVVVDDGAVQTLEHRMRHQRIELPDSEGDGVWLEGERGHDKRLAKASVGPRR
eukprot:CAMPEP_0202812034 /NCGR_PEP_ID=MMETSP1389-20130828/3755_1 /ASSEMBLY_ACC=CAM_ASM_000865 /TAXON_ID=302021 /ORGANISM="Rhodomonas sp., Strain CCMP768" /LENGTH=246 /DNA_ID=CAMNT_0049483309 /DNA_START=408 /DNA_END=1145 /DNA_ORIENTATION=+